MKSLIVLTLSLVCGTSFAKSLNAKCYEGYSYYGGYYLNAEITEGGKSTVSYGRERGPDGDGEVIKEQTFSAALLSPTRPNTSLLMLENGNKVEFDFSSLSGKLGTAKGEIKLDCSFTQEN